MLIGVVSDTHGLLRPEMVAAMSSVDHILHAGDVGDAKILERLRNLTPVTAIRGNVDVQGPCASLPPTEVVELGGFTFYLLHNLADLDLDPVSAGFAAVIYGHSHKPLIERRKGCLYFNPGSCGPRRFSLPVSAGTIEISDAGLEPRLITLA